MAERRIPTRQEVLAYLHERRNWGRWGKDDQVGAINLITPEKRIEFMLIIAPLKVVGGTGSPANPIALF